MAKTLAAVVAAVTACWICYDDSPHKIPSYAAPVQRANIDPQNTHLNRTSTLRTWGKPICPKCNMNHYTYSPCHCRKCHTNHNPLLSCHMSTSSGTNPRFHHELLSNRSNQYRSNTCGECGDAIQLPPMCKTCRRNPARKDAP